MSIEILKAEYNEIDKLEQLNPVGINNWKSEFFDSKMPNSFVFIASESNHFTSVEGYIGYKLCSGGEIIQSHRSERTLLLPTMRGKGIFEKLVQACHNESNQHGSICCWGATSALKPFKKAGFNTFEKWRKYYFIPTQGFRFYQFKELWLDIRNFKKERSIDNFINLGSTLACLLPCFITLKKKYNVCEVSKFEYSKIYKESVDLINDDSNDFRIFIDINFLDWIEERGINLKFLKISSSSGASYFCFKSNGDKMMIMDYVLAPEMNLKQTIKSLKSFSNQYFDFKAVVLSFNLENSYSASQTKKLPLFKISSPSVGSFVIHPGIKDVSIKQLRITPIWLEL